MDPTEIIALGIVVIAVLLVIRYFIKQKGGSCCSKDCFKPKDPSTKKWHHSMQKNAGLRPKRSKPGIGSGEKDS